MYTKPERITIKANRNVVGATASTVWSMLVGGESYSAELPEGFHTRKDKDGSTWIITPKGESYAPHKIIIGDDHPYLKIGYQVFPLSNFRPEYAV